MTNKLEILVCQKCHKQTIYGEWTENNPQMIEVMKNTFGYKVKMTYCEECYKIVYDESFEVYKGLRERFGCVKDEEIN